MVLITYYVLYITTLIIRKINSIELYTRTKTKEKPKMQTQVTQSAQDNLPITEISSNQNKILHILQEIWSSIEKTVFLLSKTIAYFCYKNCLE